MGTVIKRDFFESYSCLELSKKLLGKILCRSLEDGTVLRGRIVETEAYLGAEDTASYSYGGRRSAANQPMYMEVGTCFTRLTYGMYYCFNISAREDGAAVLLRAIEPLQGMQTMVTLRRSHRKAPRKLDLESKPHQLGNGPSKLCICLHIDSNLNKVNLLDDGAPIWLEEDGVHIGETDIVESTRVGIPANNAWSSKLLRFYVKHNACVSKP